MESKCNKLEQYTALLKKRELSLKKVYSKSFRLGLRDGSLDKNPKINTDTKKTTVI